ncbi:hypothetical protein [Arthrobacter antioxidans]|uniref:hypothetical protein n=1 Tax=Arthrobacter antioxidans TaxID=2895818 RepID=UPI0020004F45|nr:hypothetical protein [Arthrobacter antioxidans]
MNYAQQADHDPDVGQMMRSMPEGFSWERVVAGEQPRLLQDGSSEDSLTTVFSALAGGCDDG